jgi:hypothetical protein
MAAPNLAMSFSVDFKFVAIRVSNYGIFKLIKLRIPVYKLKNRSEGADRSHVYMHPGSASLI